MKYDRINILGLGNILHSDEGFGIAALNSLRDSTDFPKQVCTIDGGTQGIYLLDHIQSCDALLVFDALIPVEYDSRVYVYRNDDLPDFIHRKMSSHQMGFSELLGVARLQGKIPREIVLIGVPPRDLQLRIGLSPEVSSLLGETVERATLVVESWLNEK
ncbi:HyaD/HybD family hydrogenase maturation endopeptidase [Pelodictyon luteolum]|uniref:Peptidase M52, hydrogen uptake protein n=1 Tax=Chlorobium luteolum (strain DSM 273 / BCRC 81028 / 2530) TaxID=319225 RepID=Q3B2X3_CHLL3|nr:HyaD/HybD family hydrogenase maturation endopeptidase [Pelodictyon luteolum]ABB24308.1 Peptidase M52, hydrogen uptake protein [Pelodictyon luteolum DSM 273]